MMNEDQPTKSKSKLQFLKWVLVAIIAMIFFSLALGISDSPNTSWIAAILKYYAIGSYVAAGLAAIALREPVRMLLPRRPHFLVVLAVFFGFVLLGTVIGSAYMKRVAVDAQAVGFASEAELETAQQLGFDKAAPYKAYLREKAAAQAQAEARAAAERAKVDAAFAAAEKLVLGRWLMPIGAQYMITIRHSSDGYEAQYDWHDGHSFVRALHERHSREGRRFDIVGDVSAAYYLVLANGDLDIRDKDGEFVHAVPFHGNPRDHASVVAALDQALLNLQTAQARAADQNAPGESSDSAGTGSGGPSKWTYSQTVDQMRGTITRLAMVDSDNELEFDFPYSGGSTGTFMLRQRPSDGLQIMLIVSKGQFTCDAFEDSHVSVKFDDGPVARYACAQSSDGSSNCIFIEGAERFVRHLRSAHKVLIEAEFYEEGPQQLVFETSGLTWQ